MITPTLQLFRVVFEVKLTSKHPMFFNAGDGFFSIWLFDESKESAVLRAALIIEQLPFERVGDGADVVNAIHDKDDRWRISVANAKQLGIACRLDCLTLEAAIPEPSDPNPE